MNTASIIRCLHILVKGPKKRAVEEEKSVGFQDRYWVVCTEVQLEQAGFQNRYIVADCTVLSYTEGSLVVKAD